MTSTKNTTTTVAGLFNVVSAEEIPSKISRAGRTSQWAEAVRALRDLEMGQGLSLQTFGENSKNNIRQNMIQANRSHGGSDYRMMTRSERLLDEDGNPVVDSEGRPGFVLYFVKVENEG